MINLKQAKSYTFIAIAPPLSGHMVPLLRLAKALLSKGHNIYFATSFYKTQKIKQDFPDIKIISLNDNLDKLQKQKGAGYVPVRLLFDQWKDAIRTATLEIKPDAFIVDIMCATMAQIAGELGVKNIVNVPSNNEMYKLMGGPTYENSFSFFGFTIFKPSLFQFLIHNLIPDVDRLIYGMCNSLVLVNSSFALQEPTAIAPNTKLVGITLQDSTEHKQFQPDLKQWINNIQKQQLGIIYVTFGSLVDLTQKFIDHVYYGLKKLNMGVIWSLKQGKIPEQNSRFYVREWLAQQQLLQLKSVKVVISHCGWGGVCQSIHALKPILAVPLFGDQPINADLIVKKGIALLLRKSDTMFSPHVIIDNPKFTHQQLEEKINRLVNDEGMTERIERIRYIASKDGGVKKCCELIEEAVEIGYSHLVDKKLAGTMNRCFFNTLKWVGCGAMALGAAAIGYYHFKGNLKLQSS